MADASGGAAAVVFIILLVLQNVGAAMATRYSRLLPGPPWLGTTGVVVSECIKFVASCLLVFLQRPAQEDGLERPDLGFWKKLFPDRNVLLMGVPGLLYTVQNNLYYIGLANLSVSLFQVLAQCKILSTAVFSVIILSRQLGLAKWCALLLLTFGVMLIVVRGDTSSKGKMSVGVLAVSLACCTSGLAGVFLEKMLKDSGATIWERNAQLATFGILFSTAGVAANDWAKVAANGFFQGYNFAVVAVVLLQALGGLVVAAVLKYADNLVKCFAVAVSVILGSIASRVFYAEGPRLTDPLFLSGTMAVVFSTILYSIGWQGMLSIVTRSGTEREPPAKLFKMPPKIEELKPKSKLDDKRMASIQELLQLTGDTDDRPLPAVMGARAAAEEEADAPAGVGRGSAANV